MKCCGSNNNNNTKGEEKKHSPIKHMLMMVLCCGLPWLILAVLPFISIGAGFKAGLATIAPFICPIMMIFMIPMMLKGRKKEGSSCCDDKANKSENITKIEQ